MHHAAPRPRSRRIQLGLLLFVLGMIFIAIDVLPFFAGDHNTALWLNLACLLAPLGFAITACTVLGTGRAEQRAAVRDLSSAPVSSAWDTGTSATDTPERA